MTIETPAPTAAPLASARTVTVLGIETSCDETAAAVLRIGEGAPEILADIVWSQHEAHAPYRGVVPEIAARAHAEKTDLAIAAAMGQAGLGFDALDAIAATAGPGLIGGVMVGLSAGAGLAFALDRPLFAINHLEGHALSPLLGAPSPFPYLLLLASGGHCQFVLVESLGRYRRLGSTVDDAAGEAFDKAAKVMGLGFPGGPALERAAAAGDPRRFPLPRPLMGRPGCDFSFAGLKTAALRAWQNMPAPTDQDRSDLAASFQAAVAELLVDRTRNAIALAGQEAGRRFVVAGGVAANSTVRARLTDLCGELGATFTAPQLRHCTDNAAMIALAGALRLQAGLPAAAGAVARPRWPLDELAAANDPMHAPGRKGPKA